MDENEAPQSSPQRNSRHLTVSRIANSVLHKTVEFLEFFQTEKGDFAEQSYDPADYTYSSYHRKGINANKPPCWSIYLNGDERERKRVILTSFRGPKWLVRTNEILHLTMFFSSLRKNQNIYNKTSGPTEFIYLRTYN